MSSNKRKGEYLSRYKELKNKYDYLNNKIYNIKGISYTEKVGNGIILTQAELIHERDEVVREMNEILTCVKDADLTPLEYVIVMSRFIDGMSYDTIARRINYSRREMFYYRNKALDKIKIK